MSKYLDKYGLEHYHDLIKSGLIEYIEGTQTGATSTWTGVSTTPALFKGKMIIYHLPYAGAAAVPTLNLTLPGGTTTGAKAVGTDAGTNYGAGADIPLVYNGSAWKNLTSSAAGVTYSDATPAMDGTASAGSSDTAARGDHVHPTDTSRQSAITYSTTDLTAGTSALATGSFYAVYE